eukprot:5277569-Prymnesium_polylepis.1
MLWHVYRTVGRDAAPLLVAEGCTALLQLYEARCRDTHVEVSEAAAEWAVRTSQCQDVSLMLACLRELSEIIADENAASGTPPPDAASREASVGSGGLPPAWANGVD